MTERELGWRVSGSMKAAYSGVPNSWTVAGKEIPVSDSDFGKWGKCDRTSTKQTDGPRGPAECREEEGYPPIFADMRDRLNA